MGPSDPPPAFDFAAFLDFMRAHNHNFMRLWTRELSQWWDDWRPGGTWYIRHFPWPRSGPGDARDGKPKFDLSRFDETYFERLRSRVAQAGERGIYVGIILFEGRMLISAKDAATGHPFTLENNVNGIDGNPNKDQHLDETHTLQIPSVTAVQEAYVRKVIDTVNDLDNVLYEISNEDKGDRPNAEWQYHMIRFIKQVEAKKPKRHPVGMTGCDGGGLPVLLDSPADWISPTAEPWGEKDVYSTNPPAADGKKVSVLDTDHTHNNAAGTWKGAKADRAWVWKAFCRGHNPIYMDPVDLGQPDKIMGLLQPHAPAILSARPAMGHTLAYARKIDLAGMTPRGDLTSTSYGLARPGTEYLIYQPLSRKAFTAELLAGTYQHEWFNPGAGAVANQGFLKVDPGRRSFEAPFEGDAVLYLKMTK